MRPELTRDGSVWRWTWPQHGLRMDVRPLGHATEGRIDAEITALVVGEDGAVAGHINAPARIDITDPRHRQSLARTLAGRGVLRVNWGELVEQGCALTLRHLREGVAVAPRTQTLTELLALDLPPAPHVVAGVLTTGVWILGGRPKSGKSWLTLGLLLAVTAGGRALGGLEVAAGDGLYLALEDNDRRLQSRAKKALAEAGPRPPGSHELHWRTSWSRLDLGGLEELDAWLAAHPATKLVVIDTLAKARPRPTGMQSGRLYDEDYQAIEGLAGLAGRHNCAIVVNHHLRKSVADDPVETLSGTMGLSGAADGILVLDRRRGSPNATLHVVGRDLEEDRQLALRWDDAGVAWHVIGDAAEQQVSDRRRAIIQLLVDDGGAMSPADVARELEIPEGACRRLLRAMAKANQITRTERGRYAAHSLSHNHLEKDDQGDHPDHPDLSPDGGPNDRGGAAKDRPKDRPGAAAFEPKDRGDRGDRPIANFGAGKDRPPSAPGRSLGDLSDGGAPMCGACGTATAADGVCWRCRDRPCRVCGEPTGSALRAYCVFCPEGAEERD